MTERWSIHHGDVLDRLPELEAGSFDAVLCDPPYGLKFMGKAWDHGVPGEPVWSLVREAIKPGAHLLAFGGTRTEHRLVCAIEDAGFEIRDKVMWLYGSGFPKSLAIDKAIDKRGGYPHLAEKIGNALRRARENRGLSVRQCDERFCGGTTNWSWFEGRPAGQRAPTPGVFRKIAEAWPEVLYLHKLIDEAEREVVGRTTAGIANPNDKNRHTVGGSRAVEVDITTPATDLAKRFHGWGTALKPAYEPCVVAMKPLDGTFAANAAAHGVAGLWIDGGRVGATVETWPSSRSYHAQRGPKPRGAHGSGDGVTMKTGSPPAGRWPANLILDAEAAAMLDAQSGALRPATSRTKRRDRPVTPVTAPSTSDLVRDDSVYGDTGGASRFFYTAKASTRERNAGLEDVEAKDGRLRQDGRFHSGGRTLVDGKWIETGSTPKPKQNNHPTLKPIDLCRYLATLILPPKRDTPRRLLVPFSGSGSEMIGALLAGWDEVVGIEREREYIDIAERRLAHWCASSEEEADTTLFAESA